MTEEKAKIVSLLKEIANELQTTTVPRHEFLRRSRLSERKIQKLFGSYNGLVQAAGLQTRRFPSSEEPSYSDQELIGEIVRVLRLPEAKLTRVFFDQHGKLSTSVCERRFGGWINALRTARTSLDPVGDSMLISRIDEYVPSTVPSRKSHTQDTDAGTEVLSDITPAQDVAHPYLEGGTSNIYGDFMNFRGLQHEPVNEQGVVFLFGMVCRELGYVVEIVRSGFPDCEAKRRIRGKSTLWQRVRIEFEFESRSFRSHGHDPDRCDLIVCWNDNWPECPLEVLELRKAIRQLSSAVESPAEK